MKLHGRTIHRGRSAGEALVSSAAISFYGGVDPETGTVLEAGHELEGQSVSGRVLVFPRGKGSTVGSYTLLRLKAAGAAPCAIVNSECETITAVGCIIAEIPCVDRVAIERLETGDWVVVDATEGTVEVVRLRGS